MERVISQLQYRFSKVMIQVSLQVQIGPCHGRGTQTTSPLAILRRIGLWALPARLQSTRGNGRREGLELFVSSRLYRGGFSLPACLMVKPWYSITFFDISRTTNCVAFSI
jgi:hypothetical protein